MCKYKMTFDIKNENMMFSVMDYITKAVLMSLPAESFSMMDTNDWKRRPKKLEYALKNGQQ